MRHAYCLRHCLYWYHVLRLLFADMLMLIPLYAMIRHALRYVFLLRHLRRFRLPCRRMLFAWLLSCCQAGLSCSLSAGAIAGWLSLCWFSLATVVMNEFFDAITIPDAMLMAYAIITWLFDYCALFFICWYTPLLMPIRLSDITRAIDYYFIRHWYLRRHYYCFFFTPIRHFQIFCWYAFDIYMMPSSWCHIFYFLMFLSPLMFFSAPMLRRLPPLLADADADDYFAGYFFFADAALLFSSPMPLMLAIYAISWFLRHLRCREPPMPADADVVWFSCLRRLFRLCMPYAIVLFDDIYANHILRLIHHALRCCPWMPTLLPPLMSAIICRWRYYHTPCDLRLLPRHAASAFA